ncbi:MAG: hypothetical protein SWQ30_00095 [Thermodesulfobacteriota bacterium]|nr:hypothetical protein [Thermodesulfobacteriota bacterium]
MDNRRSKAWWLMAPLVISAIGAMTWLVWNKPQISQGLARGNGRKCYKVKTLL